MFRSIIIALAALLAPAACALGQEQYQVDPVHSMVVFRVGHLNLGHIYGRFNAPTGTFNLNEQDPAQSNLVISVGAKNIDTQVQQRDDHLRSKDFFNVEQFPKIRFKSTSVKKVDDTTFEVAGDMALLAVTKPVTVTIKKLGEGPGMQGEFRKGYETQFDVKRSDYGMTFMPDGISDDVHLIVAIEAIRQDAGATPAQP